MLNLIFKQYFINRKLKGGSGAWQTWELETYLDITGTEEEGKILRYYQMANSKLLGKKNLSPEYTMHISISKK